MLALHLLDILVKNCGFPMHLQIATKEFLNELVRRFPERPPMHPGPVMTRILEMIHEWRQTVCLTSKYKEDLVHIRDMHRLLMYKGYRFPKMDASSASVLNTSERLQSPEELEEETRAAQSAKLQELIRRGTPRDLEQAQELMKILSGAEPDKRRAPVRQITKEMDHLESRTKLLHDMLDQAKPSDKFVSGDAYDVGAPVSPQQVATHLRGVQPRLQQWIAQAEADESDSLARFLEVNDAINRSLARYDAAVQGKPGAGSSLISFDADDTSDEPQAAAAAAPKAPTSGASLLDELSGLSLGSIPAASSSSASTASLRPSSDSLMPAPLNSGKAKAPAPPSARAPAGVFDLLGDFDEPVSSGQLSTPPLQLPTSGHAPVAAQKVAAPANDPFAGLDLLK